MEERVSSIKEGTNFETVVKIISTDKFLIDQIAEHITLAFECEPTSPKMYDGKKDQFFQYFSVTKREA